MSDYPTGGGYNWWDTDFSTTDTDTDITDVDFSTYDTADADTVAADQQIEDLFEDPDFIASLAQLMEEQNFFPDEQSLGEWTNDDWDSYFENFLNPNYNWWDTDFGTYGQDIDFSTYGDDDVYGGGESVDLDGNPLPNPGEYEENNSVIRGGGTYVIKNGIWHEVKEGEGGETVDVYGDPLPNPEDYEEGYTLDRDGYIYVIKDGIWQREEDEDDDDLPTGIFGGTAGPKIKDWLKGVFGIPESFEEGDTWWQKLLKIYLGGKQFKEGLDAIQYEVPTGQSAAMSEYEKANPLDIDVGLESLGPNYLEDQLYGIPIGAENVPAATHTLGLPYAEEIQEEVQGAQRGGIMNARSHGDIVPALLEPGEFVMTLQSVKGAGNGDARQGAKNMYKMMRQLEGRGQ